MIDSYIPHCKLSAQKIGKISSMRIPIEEKKTFLLMVLRVNKEPNGMSQDVTKCDTLLDSKLSSNN